MWEEVRSKKESQLDDGTEADREKHGERKEEIKTGKGAESEAKAKEGGGRGAV